MWGNIKSSEGRVSVITRVKSRILHLVGLCNVSLQMVHRPESRMSAWGEEIDGMCLGDHHGGHAAVVVGVGDVSDRAMYTAIFVEGQHAAQPQRPKNQVEFPPIVKLAESQLDRVYCTCTHIDEDHCVESTIQTLGIDKLSLDEQLALVRAIWDHIAASSSQPQLSDARRDELRRRVADDEARPDDLIPWDQVKLEARHQARCS